LKKSVNEILPIISSNIINVKEDNFAKVECPFCGELYDDLLSHIRNCEFTPENVSLEHMMPAMPKKKRKDKPTIDYIDEAALQAQYEKETGLKAIWRFKKTKSYKEWKTENFFNINDIMIATPKEKSKETYTVKHQNNKIVNNLECPFCGKLFNDLASHIRECEFVPEDVNIAEYLPSKPKKKRKKKKVSAKTITKVVDLSIDEFEEEEEIQLKFEKRKVGKADVEDSDDEFAEVECPFCGEFCKDFLDHGMECKFIPDYLTFDFKNNFLEVYEISEDRIMDFSGIKGLEKITDLKKLKIEGNFYKMKGLEKLVNLEYLCLIGNILEIKGLETFVNLKELYLPDNQITEIKGLENLKNLEYLDLSGNQITEIKGLENLRNLKVVTLYNKNSERYPNIDFPEKVLLEILGEDAKDILWESCCITDYRMACYDETYPDKICNDFYDNAQKFVRYCRQKKEEVEEEDMKIIDKIKQMTAKSASIRLNALKNTLKMDAHTFNKKILDWAVKFGFEIDGDYLITQEDTISEFISELERHFTIWNKMESEKHKKIK